MSRSNPFAFVLGMTIEIGAVVFIVSLLPRIDLRPSTGPASAGSITASSAAQAEAPSKYALNETSYYQPQSPAPPRLNPPPLISAEPTQREYVAQRLDRASQQLVNTTGSYALRTANNWLPDDSNAATSQPGVQLPAGARSFPVAASPSVAPSVPNSTPAKVARQRSMVQTHPRPWLRY